ncbi:MAG: ATP-binding protein, partial [Chloroflexota bacterium]|nr:ATP-binding protein [Chloroflexota bacterium]
YLLYDVPDDSERERPRHQNGRSKEIEMEHHQNGRSKKIAHCAVWIADTGIGISPEEKADIWERFYRPTSPLAAEASGLGVGLSIVKSLVEAHDGRVWLESTLGKGSKFTVLLPIERAQPVGERSPTD